MKWRIISILLEVFSYGLGYSIFIGISPMLSVKWIVTCLGGTEQVIVIVLSSSSWGLEVWHGRMRNDKSSTVNKNELSQVDQFVRYSPLWMIMMVEGFLANLIKEEELSSLLANNELNFNRIIKFMNSLQFKRFAWEDFKACGSC